MTKCTSSELRFPSCKSRKVATDFSGGNITSYGGTPLFRQASVEYSVESMLRQRVFADSAAGRCFAGATRTAWTTSSASEAMPGSNDSVLISLSKRKRTSVRRKKNNAFSERFEYAAATWDRERRVIIKAEHSALGENTRFILTSLDGDPQKLYDTLYCARGNMENQINEQQLDLYADRTSCHNWWANQMRLLISSWPTLYSITSGGSP